MSQLAIKHEDTPEQIQPGKRVGRAVGLILIVYLVAWTSTRAHFMADTNVYAQAILRHQLGGKDVDYHLTTSNPFWDFGHILWRPIGWLCFLLSQPITQWATHHNQRVEVILTLLGINFLAAVAGVVLFFLLARKILGDEWAAIWATIGLFCADAFLNYAHSGNAYVVGLSWLVAGMYFSFAEELRIKSSMRALITGLMYALAVLFWFPYVFALPAAIAAPLLLQHHDRQRLRFAGETIATCAVLGITAYGIAILFAGVRSAGDLKEWILAAGHGHIQAGGLRAAARLAFAVPRSFIHMDRDGMWLKRYLLHDPYAPVTTAGLFRFSLWKLALFYASMAAICVELWWSKQGRMVILLLAGVTLPICIFAVFIFEAGSIERYLPLYPFVFLAFGYVIAREQTSRASRILMFTWLAALIVVNIHAMRRSTLDSQRTEVATRLQSLIPALGPNDLVMAVNEQDNLAEFRQNFPLDALNQEHEWRTYDVLEINTERLSTWREDFGRHVLGTWRRGGKVWLPLRMLQNRPKPEWNWVEGDDKRVKWTDLPTFFSQFDLGAAVGNEDGFILLQNDVKNRDIFGGLVLNPS
jgi:hypothetical protein